MSDVINLGSGLGFEIPAAPEPQKPVFFSAQESADLAVATYSQLGLVRDKGQATDSITGQMESLHDVLVRDHPNGGLEVIPFCPVNLEAPFTLRALFLIYYGGNETNFN